MKLSVDRYENGTAVCLDVSENEYRLDLSPFGIIPEGDIIEAEFSDDGRLISAIRLKGETELRKKALKSRLQGLFGKNNN